MGKARTAITLLNASPYIVRLLCSLFVVWLTLGWKVRKARKAFEKELIKQGMSKEDAKRLGTQYTLLKDNLMNGVKRYIRIR